MIKIVLGLLLIILSFDATVAVVRCQPNLPIPVKPRCILNQWSPGCPYGFRMVPPNNFYWTVKECKNYNGLVVCGLRTPDGSYSDYYCPHDYHGCPAGYDELKYVDPRCSTNHGDCPEFTWCVTSTAETCQLSDMPCACGARVGSTKSPTCSNLHFTWCVTPSNSKCQLSDQPCLGISKGYSASPTCSDLRFRWCITASESQCQLSTIPCTGTSVGDSRSPTCSDLDFTWCVNAPNEPTCQLYNADCSGGRKLGSSKSPTCSDLDFTYCTIAPNDPICQLFTDACTGGTKSGLSKSPICSDIPSLYQRCYHYDQIDPSAPGSCRLFGTCLANEIPIGPTTTDSTCSNVVLEGVYYRCVDKASPATANCRPKEAGCRPVTAGPLEIKDCMEFGDSASCLANAPIDCQAVHEQHSSVPSSACFLYPDGAGTLPIYAYCDMITDGGGWTVIQRRFDGTVEFYKTYAEYATGFGDVVAGEYWLGNDNIYKLTTGAAAGQTLKIDLEISDGGVQTGWAYYSGFAITDSSTNYILSVTYVCDSGVGDSMTLNSMPNQVAKDMKFTTKDQDNDNLPFKPEFNSANCAEIYKGGWWYNACHMANLNGQYGDTVEGEGLNWYTWKGYFKSMTKTTMKIRRSLFTCV